MSAPTLEEVLALPFVTWETRKTLPDVPGLYFVISGEWVIYVGKSERSIRSRWIQRAERRRMLVFGHFRIAYMAIEDPSTIGAREIEAIRAFSPPINGAHIPGGSADHQETWPFLRINDLRRLRRMRREGAVALEWETTGRPRGSRNRPKTPPPGR
jgi:hypothetical protein